MIIPPYIIDGKEKPADNKYLSADDSGRRAETALPDTGSDHVFPRDYLRSVRPHVESSVRRVHSDIKKLSAKLSWFCGFI
jgi:hypothetical protein